MEVVNMEDVEFGSEGSKESSARAFQTNQS